MKYRTKPCVIEAERFDNYETFKNKLQNRSLPEWILIAYDNTVIYDDVGSYYIETLEGDHLISDGDYIIRGLIGELYPCKPEVFHKKYELVE